MSDSYLNCSSLSASRLEVVDDTEIVYLMELRYRPLYVALSGNLMALLFVSRPLYNKDHVSRSSFMWITRTGSYQTVECIEKIHCRRGEFYGSEESHIVDFRVKMIHRHHAIELFLATITVLLFYVLRSIM